MNLFKTMVMTNSTEVQIYYNVGNEPLHYTENFIYLAMQISFNRLNYY